MLDLKSEINLHYHQKQKNDVSLPPVENVTGDGNGWAKEVDGNVQVKAVDNRTTLHLKGSGAMKINGALTIGG